MNHSLKESNLFSNCSRRPWYLHFVYDRKPAARTSAPGSSPSSPEPDHIQVIPTVIVPKRKMGTKQKPKRSFGFESTSRGPDNKPSNMETDLLELLVHFRMQQESHHVSSGIQCKSAMDELSMNSSYPLHARTSSQGSPARAHQLEKCKAEDQILRLVRMVKTGSLNTPNDIRTHMDRLCRSLGGFCVKTFNAIV
ncbi:hypothetical protein HPB51_026822 [Rhipicephalus microplus]|uniref:Uncharacterized protein n=1 Tax=Rhipicephalus microplus TaxID=6941 RepID=A0A9J6D1X4_RHIMP|nr:hypothetical protein HPB51_026822 [Rhipicephalus microplus]